jgi:hypothetical protein
MNDKRIEDAGTLVRSQSQSEYSAVVIRVSSAARTVNRWYSTRPTTSAAHRQCALRGLKSGSDRAAWVYQG